MLKIESLSMHHVEAVAALHCASLRGLLTRLGPYAAREFYFGSISAPLAVGLVAIDDTDTLRGFVLGSKEPASVKRDVARQRPLAVAGAVALGVARQPRALGWLLGSFRGPDEGTYNSEAPELTYLAVAPGQRGGGIGRQLVNAFSAAMRKQGVHWYELSVDEDNSTAIAFYERVGFKRIGRYREFGQYHARYGFDLSGNNGHE